MLLATDLAALDHHEGTVTLIANAVNWDATDERVDAAYDDAVARLDADDGSAGRSGAAAGGQSSSGPSRAAAGGRGSPTTERGGRGRQGAHPGRRRLPDRGVAAVRRAAPTPTRWTSTGCCGPPTRARTCTCCGCRRPTASRCRSSAPRRRRWSRCGTGTVTMHPIAGTRPRGVDEEDDVLLAKDLLADAKERSEHVMLVDLGRNDLGRVCAPGTVKVVDFFTVERYSHVMHIVSTVTGPLAPGRTAFDALTACFPAGTLSGAPKPRAMQIIDELEPARRGLYGGIVGYLDFAGDADTAITIRTALLARRRGPRPGRAPASWPIRCRPPRTPSAGTRPPRCIAAVAAAADTGGRSAVTGRTGRRTVILAVLAALLAVGAVALVAGAAALTWWSADLRRLAGGRGDHHGHGSQAAARARPGCAARARRVRRGAAPPGLPRRVVGGLLVLGGALVTVAVGRRACRRRRRPAAHRSDPAGDRRSATPQLHPVGPVLAALGGCSDRGGRRAWSSLGAGRRAAGWAPRLRRRHPASRPRCQGRRSAAGRRRSRRAAGRRWTPAADPTGADPIRRTRGRPGPAAPTVATTDPVD